MVGTGIGQVRRMGGHCHHSLKWHASLECPWKSWHIGIFWMLISQLFGFNCAYSSVWLFLFWI